MVAASRTGCRIPTPTRTTDSPGPKASVKHRGISSLRLQSVYMAEPHIKPAFSIPNDELKIRYQTSSGPGGQNVNKTSTRAVVQFNVAQSPSLTEPRRRMVTEKLANRINAEGWLTVECEETRSQATNRKRAIERLNELIRAATIPPKRRRPTKPSRGAVQRRLTEKSRRGAIKRQRSGGSDEP